MQYFTISEYYFYNATHLRGIPAAQTTPPDDRPVIGLPQHNFGPTVMNHFTL
jgi:hypothetical protein